jgi:hypothetical protein
MTNLGKLILAQFIEHMELKGELVIGGITLRS